MSEKTYTAAEACRDGYQAIQRADGIANSGSSAWDHERQPVVQNYLLRAAALALLSVAANLETFRTAGFPVEEVRR